MSAPPSGRRRPGRWYTPAAPPARLQQRRGAEVGKQISQLTQFDVPARNLSARLSSCPIVCGPGALLYPSTPQASKQASRHSLSSRSSRSPLSLASRSAMLRALCSDSSAAVASANRAVAASSSALRLACARQGGGEAQRKCGAAASLTSRMGRHEHAQATTGMLSRLPATLPRLPA